MQPRRVSRLREILTSVRAVGSGEVVSLDETELTDPGVDARRGIG